MEKYRVIRILSVLCVLSVAAMAAALLSGGGGGTFVPPPFDPSAQEGIPDVPDGLGYQMLDAGPFRVALCAEIGMEELGASVYLTNPADNVVWLKLRILDETGDMLGETGLLRPGEYVKNVPLREAPGQGEPIVLKVMAYEPDTYHSQGAAVLNTRMGE